MSEEISLTPDTLRWARLRASLDEEALAKRVGLKVDRIRAWEADGLISFPHLERLAASTSTPFGFLFLAAPPEEPLPIEDFRSVEGQRPTKPTPELLETIYQCQRRQDWFREYVVSEGSEALPFVGRFAVTDDVARVAADIVATLRLDLEDRVRARTPADALSRMVERAEEALVLVMRSSVVGNNSSKKLKAGEFRGFALSDRFAPLIFINTDDPKSAQIFTLAHELCHVWLGETGVSDPTAAPARNVERFCNRVAAHILAPEDDVRREWMAESDEIEEIQRLAKRYKISRSAMLIRARDLGLLPLDRFEAVYGTFRARAAEDEKDASSGGDFYRTQNSRLGRLFARSVILSAREGKTLYRDAMELLGMPKTKTFEKYAESLGVAA